MPNVGMQKIMPTGRENQNQTPCVSNACLLCFFCASRFPGVPGPNRANRRLAPWPLADSTTTVTDPIATSNPRHRPPPGGGSLSPVNFTVSLIGRDRARGDGRPPLGRDLRAQDSTFFSRRKDRPPGRSAIILENHGTPSCTIKQSTHDHNRCECTTVLGRKREASCPPARNDFPS